MLLDHVLPSEDPWEDVEVDFAEQPDEISSACEADVSDSVDEVLSAYGLDEDDPRG